MKKEASFAREGYLHENYHYFHLRDTAGQEGISTSTTLTSSSCCSFPAAWTTPSEDTVYRLRPWVLLVKHHAIHKALINKSEPYDRIIIYLDRKYF